MILLLQRTALNNLKNLSMPSTSIRGNKRTSVVLKMPAPERGFTKVKSLWRTPGRLEQGNI